MKLQIIQNGIFDVRGQKVMLDFHLAELYEVETRVLKQAVRRNLDLFPPDFMFQLNRSEWKEVITICDNLLETIKFSPATSLAFTEHGVTMLANVLRSRKARQRSIAIIRAFIALKQFALTYKELTEKIAKLEKKYNRRFADVYEALDLLLREKHDRESWVKRRRIGFRK